MTSPVAIPRGTAVRFDPRPKLVLFDLDNTLCNYARARQVRTRYALEPCFVDMATCELAVTAALAHASDGSDHFADVLAAHGVDDVDVVAEAQARYIEDRYRGLQLYEDAVEVVAAVARTGRVGLITNGPADIQRPKVERLEIGGIFPLIIISGEVGVWKPDPAIFHLALEQAGARADETIYVGDSAEHDVPGAHAAGIKAVWINRAGLGWPGGPLPEVEIRDLHELLSILGLELLA